MHVAYVGGCDQPSGEAVHAQLARSDVRLDEAAVHTACGDPVLEIARIAEDLCVDLVIVGPQDRPPVRPGHAMEGTLAIAASVAAPCLIVEQAPELPLRHVVVAVDGSEPARTAMYVALAWASALRGTRMRLPFGGRLTALHVNEWPADAGRAARAEAGIADRVRKLEGTVGTQAGVVIEGKVVRGPDVAAGIAEFVRAHGVTLVVAGRFGMSTHEHRDVGRVAAEIVRTVGVPTLLVPPAVWPRARAMAECR
jgi:nucleotide-binding universal stress UspA family protein